MTDTAIAQAQPPKRLSTQMVALLLIFSADAGLMASVEPFVDLTQNMVDWDQILKIPFSSGHWAAVLMAYSMWTDGVLEGSNPFEAALNMDRSLKRGCIQALELRWGLKA